MGTKQQAEIAILLSEKEGIKPKLIKKDIVITYWLIEVLEEII